MYFTIITNVYFHLNLYTAECKHSHIPSTHTQPASATHANRKYIVRIKQLRKSNGMLKIAISELAMTLYAPLKSPAKPPHHRIIAAATAPPHSAPPFVHNLPSSSRQTNIHFSIQLTAKECANRPYLSTWKMCLLCPFISRCTPVHDQCTIMYYTRELSEEKSEKKMECHLNIILPKYCMPNWVCTMWPTLYSFAVCLFLFVDFCQPATKQRRSQYI